LPLIANILLLSVITVGKRFFNCKHLVNMIKNTYFVHK
jgi:hypothetical protein